MKLSLNDFSSVVASLRPPDEGPIAAELRSSTRINCWSRIDAIVNGGKRAYSAMMRDISLGGAGLLQSMTLSEGQNVLIVLPRPKTPLAIYCSVLHCRTLAEGLLVVGIRYEKLAGDEVAKQLAEARIKEQARIQQSILQ